MTPMKMASVALVLVCLFVTDGQAQSNTSMCTGSDSDFVLCSCMTYESMIQDLMVIIGNMNFTDRMEFVAIMNRVQMFARELTETIIGGICQPTELDSFKTCLDTSFRNSTNALDLAIKSVVDTTNLSEILSSTLCSVQDTLTTQIEDCIGELSTGSVGCVTMSEALRNVTLGPTTTEAIMRSMFCPGLGGVTKCVEIQSHACGTSVGVAISGMVDQLTLPACKNLFDFTEITSSVLMSCSMPLVFDIIMTFRAMPTTAPATMSTTATTGQDDDFDIQVLLDMIETLSGKICSRIPYILSCTQREMATSPNIFDNFIRQLVDIDNIERNQNLLFDDLLCNSTTQLDLVNVSNCIMAHTHDLVGCANATTLGPFLALANNTSLMTASGESIIAMFCSPINLLANCAIDVIRTYCSVSLADMATTMVQTILRPECGGIRPPTTTTERTVGDGVSALMISTPICLLLATLAWSFMY